MDTGSFWKDFLAGYGTYIVIFIGMGFALLCWWLKAIDNEQFAEIFYLSMIGLGIRRALGNMETTNRRQ